MAKSGWYERVKVERAEAWKKHKEDRSFLRCIQNKNYKKQIWPLRGANGVIDRKSTEKNKTKTE